MLFRAILIKYSDSMSETLVPGNVGAFLTEDEDIEGYYIVMWTSSPYRLQEDERCTAYDPPMILKVYAGL